MKIENLEMQNVGENNLSKIAKMNTRNTVISWLILRELRLRMGWETLMKAV